MHQHISIMQYRNVFIFWINCKTNGKPHLFVWICSVIKHYNTIFIFQCRTRPSSGRSSHLLILWLYRGKMTMRWVVDGFPRAVILSPKKTLYDSLTVFLCNIFSLIISPKSGSGYGNCINSQGKVVIMTKSLWLYCINLLYGRQTLVSSVKADLPVHNPDLLTLSPCSHHPGKTALCSYCLIYSACLYLYSLWWLNFDPKLRCYALWVHPIAKGYCFSCYQSQIRN